MIEDGPRILWEVGDRVTRQLYLDDGTWLDAPGGRCLADSPLMHGTVEEVEDAGGIDVAVVRWDPETPLRVLRRRYYEHGIDPETPDTTHPGAGMEE